MASFNNVGQYYHNWGSKNQRLKAGYSYGNQAGAELVYHRPASKARGYGTRWGGKDSPNYNPGRSAMSIYKVPQQAAAPAAAAAQTQADIAKQLQIVQSEKSAVSKMMQEYTAMLQKEADAKAKAEEEARVSAATSAANQARSGQTANLQIQPASGAPKTAGTQPFKRRQLQFNPQTYGAVSSMKSGTLNI